MPQTPSTRWCPTAEQLMALEDMYNSGLHSPDVSQIQLITTYLSYYGKIEGKNVFYWFQNHKARERQKLRKRLTRQLFQNNNQLIHTFPQGRAQDADQQGMNLLSKLEVEQGKNGYGYDVHPWCKPPITLDLFPSKSTTGLRDDQCSCFSKNSPCSTSTNL